MKPEVYIYSHGADIYDSTGRPDNRLDFSANINPLGIPVGVKDAIISSLAGLSRYPDSGSKELCAVIAAHESTEPEYITCGSGASDLIFRLAYAKKPPTALVTAPAFSDYERACVSAGAEMIYYKLKKENNFEIREDIIDLIRREKPRLVFLCSPNNPTGTLIPPELTGEILRVCEACGGFVCMDECFLGFFSQEESYTAKKYLPRRKNLMLLKAFTKLYALPGIRLGYSICADPGTNSALRTAGPDWAVSNSAQEAGISALAGSGSYLRKTRKLIKTEREFLSSALGELGFTVYPSAANFILFEGREDLAERLYECGVRIRDCRNYRGLGCGFFRVAVRTRAENIILIERIEDSVRGNS